MIIATLLILGATLILLMIAFVAVVFGIVLPMRAELNAAKEEIANRTTAIPSEQAEALSKRADEIARMSSVKHLDVRADIVRLTRRVDEIEQMVDNRPTLVSS